VVPGMPDTAMRLTASRISPSLSPKCRATPETLTRSWSIRYGTSTSRNASLSAAGFAAFGREALRLATVVLPIRSGVDRCRVLKPIAHGIPQFGRRHHQNLWSVAAELIGED